MPEFKNPVICAIDTKEMPKAIELCQQIKPYIGAIKLGLEFFTVNGPEGVRVLKSLGLPIFLDLKFHDIPNTVAQAVKSAVRLEVDMLTIHTSGGREMMQAAAKAAEEEAARLNVAAPVIFGVTVLTSMDANNLKEIGVEREVDNQVAALARLAMESGLGGVVCSPLEIGIIRRECGEKLKLIVPGIRLAGAGEDDQKRITTPEKAIKDGADYMVIGRPITKAASPAEAARAIAESIV